MEKETVLVLHGNSGSSRDMAPIAEILKEKYNVLNLDLPLHGQNMAPVKELSILTCKDYFESLLLEQKTTDVSIIGYSDGANIAAELCGSPALQVNTCFLISPNTHYKGTYPQWLILFHTIQAFCFPFRFIQTPNTVYQRMGMMLKYVMDPAIRRHAKTIHLYYAQNDMITIPDQLKMEELLGVKSTVIANKTHLNIAHSVEIMEAVKQIFEC
jgi:esterase/lipase